MKTLKKLLVLVLCFLINAFVVYADDFVPHASLGSFDEETLTINLWYGGANVSEIEHTIKYDYTCLEYVSSTSELYSSNITKVGNENNYETDKIEAFSSEDNYNTTYATITFKVKPDFNVNKTLYITLDDFIAASSTGSKYKTDPLIITIRRESINKVYFYQDIMNDYYKRQIWINDHFANIVIGIIVVIVAIALLIITPTRFGGRKKIKNMKNKINKNSGKKSITKFDLNPDKIQEIGRKKKEEPKNKLELGSYDPLSNSRRKK